MRKTVDKKLLGKELEKTFDSVVDYIENLNSFGKDKGKSAKIDSFQHRVLFLILMDIKNCVDENNTKAGKHINGDQTRSIRWVCQGLDNLLK